MKKKTLALLGSTGSIGKTTLDIVKKTNKFKIVLIIANSNYRKIIYQIKFYKPRIVIVNNYKTFLKIKNTIRNKRIVLLNNILDIKKYIKKIDITVAAIPGIAGLEPTIKFTELSKRILLANKESIVCGWDLIKKKALMFKTELVSIDSEHFSINELIKNYSTDEVEKIYITASGGPFLNYSEKMFKSIKPKDAIKHPKWKMGKKISVDSATLMNKVLEIIEAIRLFPFRLTQYEIIIHPQSLVHAIVMFKNGITKLLYHEPNMKIPIGNALHHNKMNYSKILMHKNKYKNTINNLDFFPVDKKKFPSVKLIPKMNINKSGPIIINAANEIFVDEFLKNNIHFNDISAFLDDVIRHKDYLKTSKIPSNSIKNIYKIDTWARVLAFEIINRNKQH